MSASEPALRALATELRAAPAAGTAAGDDIREAALGCGLRLRRVRLPRRGWWRQDHGPLLARDAGNGDWVALLPHPAGGLLIRGADGRARRVGSRQAAGLGAEFFMPYPRWSAGPATAARWLALARPRRRGLFRYGLSMLGAALPPVVPAIAALVLGAAAPASWPGLLAILACMTLGGVLAGWAAALARLQHSRDANLRLHGLLWDRLLGTSPALLRKFPQKALPARLRDALASAQHEVEAYDQLCAAGCVLAAAIAVLAAAAPALAVLCGVELLAAAVILHRLWNAAGAAALAMGERAPELEQALDLVARSVPVFRGFGAAGWLLGRAGRVLAERLAAAAQGERAVINARTGGRFLFLLQPLVIGMAICAGLAGPDFSVSRFAGALLAAFSAATAMFRISAITGVRRARRLRMAAVMPALAVAADGTKDKSAAPIGRFEVLALDDVWFGYAGAAPVLRGVDLTIRRGEIIALTGAAGGGKTTLLRVMMGLAEPSFGRVSVNGIALASLAAGDFQHRIGAALPDQDFMPATIRAAILGARSLPLAAAIDAARLVGLDRDIAALPMGMHTLIVPGIIPDGLVQRLMIARAIAGQPELLFLDDMLSALDCDSCERLLRGLRGRQVTIVLTARDGAVPAAADRFLRLERGRIIR
jgi:ABC-type multidrug transport system fused ATPase/permease subunit